MLVWVMVLAALVAGACGQESGNEVAQARRMVQDIESGRYGQLRERFDNNLMRMLSEDQLAQAWEVFTNVKGDFNAIRSTQVVERGGFTVVNVFVDMDREDGQVRVSFDKEGKVAGFFLYNEDVPVPEG